MPAAQGSRQFVRGYESNITSLYDILPKNVVPQLFRQFGRSAGIFELLELVSRSREGGRMMIGERTISHYEELNWKRVVTLAAQVGTTAAGANFTFTLVASDYDANNNRPLRVGDSIQVPKQYQSTASGQDRGYRVQSIANTGAASVYTVSPYDSTAQISTAIPANTELMIGANKHAEGTGQPDGRATTLLERTHTTGISKETKLIEGGMQALYTYEENLENGFRDFSSRALAELEFELNDQMNTDIWISEENDNSVQEATNSSGNKDVRSTKGIWTWANELAQTKNYTNFWLIDDFEDTKSLFEGQSVMSQNIMFMAGSNLYNQVESAGLDFIKEFSGGTDLVMEYEGALKLYGMPYKCISKNSFNYYVCQPYTLTDPQRFGNDSYDWSNTGLMVPIGNSKINNDPQRPTEFSYIPYLSIAFLDNKNEDRTRIITNRAGVNGLGLVTTSEFDERNIYALSEYAVITAEVNKWIKVEKS